MWIRKSTTGNTTKSRSSSTIPFVEISLPVFLPGTGSPGFPQFGQAQATLGTSILQSGQIIRDILALASP